MTLSAQCWAQREHLMRTLVTVTLMPALLRPSSPGSRVHVVGTQMFVAPGAAPLPLLRH